MQLTTSDLEIQIRTTAELGGDAGDFATTIGARKLIDILKTMPGDQTVTLETQQAKMILQGRQEPLHPAVPARRRLPAGAGGRRLWPRLQRAAKGAQRPDGPGLVCHGGAGHSLLPERHFVRGRGQHPEPGGHRRPPPGLGQRRAGCGRVEPKQEVILPRKTVLELQRLLSDASGENPPRIEMQFANNQAKFTFGGMEFVTKLVEGKFPDYHRVIPANHHSKSSLGRAALLACCSAPPS